MNLSHQFQIFDPANARPVTIMGAGSVGSFAAFLLAKAGVPDITVWDADVVSSHNVPMSLYGPSDVQRLKVDALQEHLERLTGIRIKTEPRMYDGERLARTSVIACVDTMKAREVIWEQVKDRATIDFFGDSRVNAAFIDILSVVPHKRKDIDRYEALQFPDREASMQICGMHGIGYAAVRAAGILAANLTRYWSESKYEWRVTERCDTLLRVH